MAMGKMCVSEVKNSNTVADCWHSFKEHMKQITERQSGRLKNEIEKLEQRIADQ